MDTLSRRTLLVSSLALAACYHAPTRIRASRDGFACPPCGCELEGIIFEQPGICTSCGMPLAPVSEASLGHDPLRLEHGAGHFQIAGGPGNEGKPIRVDYFLPAGFHQNSEVVLILPGAGRNSADYRNAWIDIARRRSILVAVLGYSEREYDFSAYHLGGLVKNFEILDMTTQAHENSVSIHVRDEDIRFDKNPHPEEWLFDDFDRVFKTIKAVTGSEQTNYTIFGHSAGAQILHRLVLFNPGSLAQRIICANSGFYTVPDHETAFPFGLSGMQDCHGDLERALSSDLVLLLGEKDNSETAGGTFLRTPNADRQGLGRRNRGYYFLKAGRRLAKSLNVKFCWSAATIPNAGHDYIAMSRAAEAFLVNR